MIISRDIDTTMLNTVEFYFLYGCNGKKVTWPRKESVLLQYSTNGGITWNLLKEMHYRNESEPRYTFYLFDISNSLYSDGFSLTDTYNKDGIVHQACSPAETRKPVLQHHYEP